MTFWKALPRQLRERRTLIGTACLALLVAVTGWSRFAPEPEDPSRDLPPGAAPQSDYALTDFTLTLLDENGTLSVRLHGSAMQHDPERERSVFDDPRTRIQRSPDVLWRATARSGWVNDDGETIQLQQQVRLDRESGALPELRLETDSLTLFPARQQAGTDDEVLVEQPGAEVRGRGMRVDLAAGHYQLDAQVKGRYEMPQASPDDR